MKISLPRFQTVAVLAALIATTQLASAAAVTWTGGGTDLDWSTGANWGGTPPGGGDTATFGSTGTVGTAGLVNNIVDVSFTATLGSLTYNQASSGQYHTTQIPSGQTLAVTGAFTVGGLNADGSITEVGMTGDGTFQATGTAFQVGNSGSSSTSTLHATLDMSTLSTFIYNASGGTWVIAGSGSSTARAGGVLNLAGVSNNITVGTINFNTGGGNNSGFHSLIQFGAGTNVLNVGTFNVCQTKAQFATVQFLSGTPATAGLRLRGVNGNSDDTSRATLTLGDRNNSGSGNTDGEFLFNGHPVDIKAGTLTIGQDRTGSGTSTHTGVGVLQFDTGIVDATTVVMAAATGAGTTVSATGTLTVGANGTLVVGTGGLSLANRVSTAVSATGTLNINGGTVICGNNIIKTTASASGTLAMNGGTLRMVNAANTVGTPSIPINSFSATDATLELALDGTGAATRTNIIATTINANGTTTIQIDSIANISGITTFHIAKATTAFNGGVANFAVATPLPDGWIPSLSLNNNTLDLTLYPAGGTGRTLTWDGTPTGDWDLSTANWKTNGVSTAYLQTDTVQFNDTLTGTRFVSLTASTTLIPNQITVNNSGGDYTFSGAGPLGGLGSLTKQGSSTLIIDNSQVNTFSGGVLISGGTLQVGNFDANGNLPAASLITNNAILAFNRTDDITVPNDISGSGTLRQDGGGSLTLEGANTYSGATAVNAGTLVLDGTLAGALNSAGGTVVAGTGTCAGLVSLSGQLVPGTTGVAGTFTAQGGLTLNSGATLAFDLGTTITVGGGVNDLVQVNGDLAANNNAITVNLLVFPQAGSPYRLINYTGSKTGNFNPTVTVAGGTHYGLSLDQATANQVNLTFTGSGGNLLWLGQSGGTWDVGTTASWSNQVSTVSPDVFYQGDTVAFDDTPGVPTGILLDGIVAPALLTNNSSVNNFGFSGSGRISGAGNIVKDGASSLMLSTSNDFTGTVYVNGGVLMPDNNAALGATNGPTVVASGATLDLNCPTLAQDAVTILDEIQVSGPGVSSGGAIINSSGIHRQINALRFVTLLGDTTFGGPGAWVPGGSSSSTPGRWDIRGSGAFLSSGGNPYKITKVGPNQVTVVGADVDPKLGDIEIQQGVLSFETTAALGDPAYKLTVQAGARFMSHNNSVLLDKHFELNGDDAGIRNNSGTMTIVGPMTLTNACVMDVAGTALVLSNTISGSGSLTKILGAAASTATLILVGPDKSYTGGTTINSGTGKLLLNCNLNSGTGSLTAQFDTTLAGNGTNTGPVDVSGAMLPGDTGVIGSFGAGGLTFEPGATVTFDVSGASNDRIEVAGDLNLNTTPVFINVPSGTPQVGTYRLINYSGNLNGTFDTSSVTNFQHYQFVLDTTVIHQVNLIVSGGPALMIWDSTSDTTWNVGAAANWSNTLSHVASDVFYPGDSVLFGDWPGAATSINLTATVQPAAMTNDSTLSYGITGSGRISGSVGIVKQGTGTLTLGTANDFTGAVDVQAGTLNVLNNTSLGTTDSGTTIAPGATLDVGGNAANNGLNLGTEPITVSGQGVGNNGAIVNSGPNSQYNALRVVTLAGDTTFGGPGQFDPANNVGRWDIRYSPTSGTNGVLSTSGHPYSLIKTGANQVSIVGTTVDPELGNIDIQQGLMGFEGGTTSMGNPASNLTVRAGATLSFYNCANPWDKHFVLYGNGVSTNIYNWSGSNTLVGPMILNGSCVVATPGGSLAFYGSVGGSGGFNKTLGNTLYLYGNNTENGDTTVSGGTLALMGSVGLPNSSIITVAAGATLDVSGRDDLKLTLNSGQTLKGNGTVTPNLDVGAGATVSPGASIGTLTVSAAASLQGTTYIEIDKAQGQTCDKIVATGGIVPGGTLFVTNINANPTYALANGDVFPLFTAGFYFPGSFVLDPPTPGPGLVWDTSTLYSDGKLRVVATVNPIPGYITNSVSGDQMTLSWSEDRIGWYLETNAVDVANPSYWFILPGSETSNQVTITIDPATPKVFFRMVLPQP
jgi:fibronectin-binding autotransporter adhesin